MKKKIIELIIELKKKINVLIPLAIVIVTTIVAISIDRLETPNRFVSHMKKAIEECNNNDSWRNELKHAKEEYDKLDNNAKNEYENLIKQMFDMEKAYEVYEEIIYLDANNFERLNNARKMYNELPNSSKKYVSNYEKLCDLEKRKKSLEEESYINIIEAGTVDNSYANCVWVRLKNFTSDDVSFSIRMTIWEKKGRIVNDISREICLTPFGSTRYESTSGVKGQILKANIKIIMHGMVLLDKTLTWNN